MPTITRELSVGLTPDHIRESRHYVNYVTSLEEGWRLLNFHVTWAFSKRKENEQLDLIMMFAEIEVRTPDGHILQSGALLRGTTVEILPILIDPMGDRYVAFVRQARVPVGRTVLSTPAGMTDGKSTTVTMLTELEEEIGRVLQWQEPLWLNEFITGSAEPMLVTPGGSSEGVVFCVVGADVSYEELETLEGHVAGNANEGEQTEVTLIPLTSLPGCLGQYGPPCSKTVQSILMFKEYLRVHNALG